jgi:hypothetical protein
MDHPAPLDEIASDEVLRIVGEALANARAHAQAGCIEIRVQFALAASPSRSWTMDEGMRAETSCGTAGGRVTSAWPACGSVLGRITAGSCSTARPALERA